MTKIKYSVIIFGGGEVDGIKRWRIALSLIGIGWYIGLSIIAGVLGGLWLDNTINTKPLFVIIGLILGIVVAFYGVYTMIKPLISNGQDKEDA
ncbi:AtpZ/AtpI family protein [Chloroflexota bacterium]